VVPVELAMVVHTELIGTPGVEKSHFMLCLHWHALVN
jgi:hypothetical protein